MVVFSRFKNSGQNIVADRSVHGKCNHKDIFTLYEIITEAYHKIIEVGNIKKGV